MIVSDATGIPLDRIEVVYGDTDLVPPGGLHRRIALGADSAAPRSPRPPTRSSTSHASAPPTASRPTSDDVVLDRDRPASTSPARRPAALGWADLAAAATSRSPPRSTSRPQMPTFPFGAHVAVVEVDTETGRVRAAAAWSRSTTPARVLNPLLAEGQVHGGHRAGRRRRRCSKRSATTTTASR